MDRTGASCLFGRPLRLRVGLWVLERLENEDTFFQGEAASGIGYSASGVAAELERLVDLGMVERHENGTERRIYYSPRSSVLWAEAFAAARTFLASEAEVLKK